MKSYINKFSLLLVIAAFFACEKVENKVYFDGGTLPVLTANTAAVNLQPGIETNAAITFTWTNPDYKFTNGISSLDVTYTLQIDTLGGNFASSKKFEDSWAKELSKTYTVAELNGIMGNTMLLPINPRRNFTFQARIIASIGDSRAYPLTSNVITFTASPFTPPPKVEVPTNGTLWIVGSATFGSWDNPQKAPYDVLQKFTRVSNTLYQLTVALPGGGNYKLIQIPGDWGSQYRFLSGTWSSGTFEKRDADPGWDGPPSAGTYKITVDFQLGTYSVVKL
jgi:starch-binding outer membrane protein SusE/F